MQVAFDIVFDVVLLSLGGWGLGVSLTASGGESDSNTHAAQVQRRLQRAVWALAVMASAAFAETALLFIAAVASVGSVRIISDGPAISSDGFTIKAATIAIVQVAVTGGLTAALCIVTAAVAAASRDPPARALAAIRLLRFAAAFTLLHATVHLYRAISLVVYYPDPNTDTKTVSMSLSEFLAIDATILVFIRVSLVSTRFIAALAANAILAPSDRDQYERLLAQDEEEFQQQSTQQQQQQQQQPSSQPQQKTNSWQNSLRNTRRLFPFLFPREFKLRACAGICMLFLFCGRVVNVIVPLQYKQLVDQLSAVEDIENPSPYYAWSAVLTYCFLRYLQSGSGIISSLQNLFWIPVAQFNTREINVQMLRHLHSLSLQFHINRKTGEVLRVMDRGSNSVGSLLSALLFNIVPAFVDIFIAIFLFIYQFDNLTGFVVFVTMAVYIFLTVIITEWRTKFRREMNQLDSASRARAVDSLLNFETVKYYNNEKYEVDRFERSIHAYQDANWNSNTSLVFLNTAQNTVITVGLATGCLIVVNGVVEGRLTVGDFIMFVAYILQLYQPLNFFGSYYRMIQQNFIDMESMFELFDENVAVKDDPYAFEMNCTGGEIKFDNVSFRYDERQPAISNVSFTVPANTTTALVGQTGSGKSTIFRLLFRFYDPQSGRILIDGQDISKVTQSSLRRAIGVVPQDTVCFNDTIGYNIGYGDVTKSLDEIKNAAARAQIHDRIASGFPDGYETKVGERGLRLSGGEKQRVAIARTLLKDPKIILLDEATSALDNTTEALIQRSLTELTSKRTTLVIAHRLSTIVDADNIVVMRDGRIVETGTHKSLLQAGDARAAASEGGKFKTGDGEDGGWVGSYYQMWMRQLEDEQDVAAASAVSLGVDQKVE
ncbi:ATP-binding cassette sub- B member 6, mitochondrial [Physocladia obscura]|uniref:ATP-binding cassette sub- B member 6, mitochondrial n=1 Tax=Physocladia obscura TaxID=109957 RepID=A0AAD5T0S2_9FUNG|nr:ATP-binding cassette sub- B member 6, mitochondrial [Physocladia obscura]